MILAVPFHDFLTLLERHIAYDDYKLKSFSSKIQRTASAIDFIQQAPFHQRTLTNARARGKFTNSKEKHVTKQNSFDIIMSRTKKEFAWAM